jgi:hypothetical protein
LPNNRRLSRHPPVSASLLALPAPPPPQNCIRIRDSTDQSAAPPTRRATLTSARRIPTSP